jgi:hypothetical protein
VAEGIDDLLGLPVTPGAGSVPPVMRWADRTTLRSALQMRIVKVPYQGVIQPYGGAWPAVMGKQEGQEGAEHAPLRGPCVEDQLGGGAVAYLHHLGSAHQEVGEVCQS